MNNNQKGNDHIVILVVDPILERLNTTVKALNSEPDFHVADKASNGQDAIAKSKKLKPDILIIDINLPDIDVFEAMNTISKAVSTTGIILISIEDKSETIQKAMLAGARSFLTRPISMDQLYSTIRTVYTQYIPIRTRMGKLRDEIILSLGEEDKKNDLTEVNFTLYGQSTVKANRRAYLYTYAHSRNHTDNVEKDIVKFLKELGGDIPKARKAKQSPQLQLGTEITVVPECDEVIFEPVKLTKRWHGDWTRFEFEFRPSNDLVGEMLFVRVSVRIKGLEIAHIKTACDVVTSTDEGLSFDNPVLADNPLAKAIERGDMSVQVTKPYQKMFISYSRRDQEIALKRAEEIETSMGNDVFIDVKNLRAGDDWQYQLAKAIEDADVFHLLWSEHSAKSEYCRYEWEYALQKKCPENRCVGVVRPVYWQTPMPEPPEELAHLHFEPIEIDNDPPSPGSFQSIFKR